VTNDEHGFEQPVAFDFHLRYLEFGSVNKAQRNIKKRDAWTIDSWHIPNARI